MMTAAREPTQPDDWSRHPVLGARKLRHEGAIAPSAHNVAAVW